MRGRDFLKEKAGWIAILLLQMLLIALIGFALEVHAFFWGSALFLEAVILAVMWVSEYQKKNAFYRELFQSLEELDKKYLITEMVRKPEFLEGILFYDALYDINKSMNESVGDMGRLVREFKDYVEMWIHEIKIPISALSLMNYNEKIDIGSYRLQVAKISQYVEQILYYVRADAPQKDYLMKKCRLDQLINEVLLEHKEELIEGHFRIEKENTEVTVVSDAKWIKFMLGQIINNCVKYQKPSKAYIGFSVEEDSSMARLTVEDHGIGICAGDIQRVFDKSFTGENGRKVTASTGMGLYICRKMCEKLGHRIWLESEEGKYTRVMIEFGRDDYYL
ncbi:MAG: HAMP domain-containing histidine kinase [Eubacterium sp.]|nr:HAMP domain-containing histidine kinase [Eubacterium sp.]